MKLIKTVVCFFSIALLLGACEAQNDDDIADQNNGETKLEADVSYGGEVFSFHLSGDELKDKVVFMTNRVNFKVTNDLQQELNIELAGPKLYEGSSGVFSALPNLPYEIDERLASISFYDPSEQPLTSTAIKYLIGDEVVVSKLTNNSIILAYEGDAITGEQLNNPSEGHFKLSINLSYSNFELQDYR